jgi:hypothetical protein
MSAEIDQANEFDALLDARFSAGIDKRNAELALSDLMDHFKQEPTEELAKAISQKMAVYILRDRQYRSACDAVAERR